LFQHYLDHPDAITSDLTLPDDPLVRRAADYIAGMTDHFALRTAEALGFRS
jgi:dGTP triphosphohydrolase